jgi:hypothetical protein
LEFSRTPETFGSVSRFFLRSLPSLLFYISLYSLCVAFSVVCIVIVVFCCLLL